MQPARMMSPHRWRSGCVWDVFGLLGNVVAWAAILFAYIVVTVWTIVPWLGWTSAGVGNLMVVHVFYGLLVWSWIKATFSDPGYVEKAPHDVKLYETLPVNSVRVRFGEHVTYCERCNNYKPLRAHHCSTCGRCVRLMDHHCMWINNCVGEYNQKFFLLFLLYVCIAAFYTFTIILARLRHCFMTTTQQCHADKGNITYVLSAIVLFVALLFAMFVNVMGVDQLWALWKDQSYIEKIKRERGYDISGEGTTTATTSTSKSTTSTGSSQGNDDDDDDDCESPTGRSAWKFQCTRLRHVFENRGEKGFSFWWLLPVDTPHRHDRWFADLQEIHQYLQPPQVDTTLITQKIAKVS